MFQAVIPISPDLTQEEHLDAIREAYNENHTQMTLILAHKLQVAEVEIIRALNKTVPPNYRKIQYVDQAV